VRGDRQRHPRNAALEVRIDLVEAADDGDDAEIRRRAETLDKVAARHGPVRVGHDHRNISHIGRCGITEQKELNDRREDHDPEQARVGFELEQFLPDEKADALH
jgi:hypothetical protein